MSGPFQIAPTNVFSPTQIPGCTIWFDAADSNTVIRSGSTVTSWTSKGSATLTASSVGGGNILYSNYNNNPALYFNGTNTKMTTGTVSSYGTTGTTWLTASVNLTPVVENSTPVDASVIFASMGAPEKSIRYNFPPQFIIYTFNNGQIRGGRSNNDNGVRGFIDSGPSMYAYVNGVDITLTQLSATYQAGVNQGFQLGQWNTGWLLGFIQEVLVYNSALSLSQYQLAEGYLAWKWGFQGSLAANHPYKNTPVVSSFPFPSRIPPTIQTLPTVLSLTNDLPFNPRSISGCQLWLDAADKTTFSLTGSTVTQWRDKSSQANICSISSGANGPTLVGSTLQYRSASSQSLTVSQVFGNALVNQTLIIFFVGQRVTASGFQYFLSGQTTAANQIIQMGFFNDNMQINMYGPEYTVAIPAYSVSAEPVRIYSYALNPSAVDMVMNGTTLQSTAQTPRLTAFTGPQIGRRYTGGDIQYHNFNLNEIIAYGPSISTSQRQQIEGYLAWKWGLTASLPNGHPYKTPPLAPFPYAIRAATQVVFSPLSIPGCSLWLDAKDRSTVILSGSSVTQWNDKSGNGYNFTASGSGITYVSNGILFVDNNYMVNSTIPTFQNQNTLFLVLKATGINASGIGMIFTYGNNANTDYYGYRILAPGTGTSTSYSWDVNPPGNGGNLDFNGVATLYVNGVTGTSNTYSIYNQSILSAPGNGGIAAGSGTLSGITLSRSFNNRYYNGYNYEVMLYNSKLNTQQRQQVEGYLAWKWGLQGSLPATHPYKLFPPK